jgi:Domain of unknown function (DUF4335)
MVIAYCGWQSLMLLRLNLKKDSLYSNTMPPKIHRFTPPTCTLEVTEQKSPLPHQQSAEPAKQFQFELRFDDPRQATTKQITIQGDQQDLLQLQIAINHYIQIQLQSSFQAKNLAENIQITPPLTTRFGEQIPYLTPQGFMHHELFFGSLTHDSDRSSIRLGTVQLFDLVAALEAYQAKIQALSGVKPSRSWREIIPLGGGIAAIAILAIAMATVFKPQPQPNIATDTSQSQSQSQSKIPELNEITPPPAPDPRQQAVSTPKLTEPLTSAKRLPPPPAVETPKPKPDIPDPADYELSDVARQSGFDTPAKAKISSNQGAKSETTILANKPTPPTASQTKITFRNQAQEKADIAIEAIGETVETKDLVAPSAIADRSSVKPTARIAAKQPSQIEAVTAYFEDKWQPPGDLTQSLEYRLLLDRNGSIKRVVPLGKAAQLYLSQTNIPVNGEPFIAPLTPSQSSTIRLLLNPNGGVQVFTELK